MCNISSLKMSCRKRSISCDSLPKERKIEDDSKSVSEETLPNISSEGEESEGSLNRESSFSTLNYASLNGEDIFSRESSRDESPCEKVKRVFANKAAEDGDEMGSLPCNSCEFIEPIQLIETFNCWGCCKKSTPWKKMSEYWLISVPKEEQTLENLNAATKNLSQNYKFHTPMLKVGILNTLIDLTEDLKTLDKFVKEVVVNLLNILKAEVKNNPEQIDENLRINNLSPATFLTRFKWDRRKYQTWHQIPVIADAIYTYADNINECMKNKLNCLEKINASIKPFEQRDTERLAVRYLGDIVKKEHFVDSHFLTTLLVVVPNKKRKLWETSYSHLCEMVVPDSSRKIFSDAFDTLYGVILPLKFAEQFKRNAKMHRFIVRDYTYSEKNQKAEKKHYRNLEIAKIRLTHDISKWTRLMFGEAFEAWIHVIALRIFVESVVRFGLPVNYEAVLLFPLQSKSKLKKTLHKLYKDFDTGLAVGDIDNIPGGLAAYYGVEEYYPYVYFNINLGFLYT